MLAVDTSSLCSSHAKLSLPYRLMLSTLRTKHVSQHGRRAQQSENADTAGTASIWHAIPQAPVRSHVDLCDLAVGTPQQQADSSGAEPSPSTNQPAVPTGTSPQASTSGMERQLSLDTAKDQHSYRSWNRAGIQHQGLGPMVNAQTIPARGANTEGVSASWLHISVRRHYKEKGMTL